MPILTLAPLVQRAVLMSTGTTQAMISTKPQQAPTKERHQKNVKLSVLKLRVVFTSLGSHNRNAG